MNLNLFSLPSNAFKSSLNGVMVVRSKIQGFFILGEQLRKDELSQLPPDVLVKILSYLPTEEIVKSARVCRSFKKLQSESFLWKILIERMCPTITDGIFQNLSLKNRENFAKTSIQIAKFNSGSLALKRALEINKNLLIATAIIQVPIVFHMLAALDEATILRQIEAYMEAHPDVTKEEARIAIKKAWEAIRDSTSISFDY